MAHRILVTGASGFAGSHLLELLSTDGEVDAWTRAAVPPWAMGRARWRQVDLMNRSAVHLAIRDRPPDVVYHCAGSPHVASSWSDTATPLARNVIGTHHLFDALRRSGRATRVLLPGSATVYAPSGNAIDEDCSVAPVSPYALSKFAQERLGLRAIVEDGVDVVITRSFNHTGPRQTPDFVAPSMARQVALIEIGAMEPVLKVGNLDARRDFTDVRDVVAAYKVLMDAGQAGSIYNVASGVAPSMHDLLDALLTRAAVSIRVDTDPARMRPHDIPVLVGDSTKLRAATGWSPQVSFERMMDDLLDYWRNTVGSRPKAEGSG